MNNPYFLTIQYKHHVLIKAVPAVKHHKRIKIKCTKMKKTLVNSS